MILAEPGFWAAAVPAVLLMGISKSGFGMGFGALAVPLMALAVPVPQAAAIMLPLLMVADAMGLAALVRHRDRVLVRRLLPPALLGVGLGWAGFGLLSPSATAGLLGVVTLVFLALRTLWPPRADAPPPSARTGQALSVVSGFTSFIAHAGSPPLAFYLLPLKLEPLVFTASTSVIFAAVNAAKWVPYGLLGLLDLRNLLTSLALLPLVPLGVWLGLRFVRQVSPQLFYRLFNLGLLLTGLKLVADALR